MSKQNSAPTMKDVAREAGVALGTVSKVINGIPVGESYRVRVEAAIEKLNYRINSYAQGLKSNKTYTIAVMVPNLVSPYFCKVVNCINRELAKRSYRMLLCATDYDPEQEQAYRLARSLSSQNVLDYIELSEDYGIIDLPTPESWVGKDLKGLNIRAKLGINILAIKKEQQITVSPAADHVICKGDILVILGDTAALKAVQKL